MIRIEASSALLCTNLDALIIFLWKYKRGIEREQQKEASHVLASVTFTKS